MSRVSMWYLVVLANLLTPSLSLEHRRQAVRRAGGGPHGRVGHLPVLALLLPVGDVHPAHQAPPGQRLVPHTRLRTRHLPLLDDLLSLEGREVTGGDRLLPLGSGQGERGQPARLLEG